MRHLIVSTLMAIAVLLSIKGINAQCTVSPHTTPGFYPTTLEGIHPAAANDFYSLNVTVVIPKDTAIQPYPNVNIDSATVKEFIGFPSSFQFDYYPASTWIHGDSAGCVLIHGTPTSADVGVHSISLVFSALLMGIVTYTDTLFDYWQFEVKDSTNISIPEISGSAGSLHIYPNPASDRLLILSRETSVADVAIYDASGKLLIQTEEHLTAGHPVSISLEALEPGMYVIRVGENGSFHTQKLTIMR